MMNLQEMRDMFAEQAPENPAALEKIDLILEEGSEEEWAFAVSQLDAAYNMGNWYNLDSRALTAVGCAEINAQAAAYKPTGKKRD